MKYKNEVSDDQRCKMTPTVEFNSDFEFGRQELTVASASPRMANHPRKGRG